MSLKLGRPLQGKRLAIAAKQALDGIEMLAPHRSGVGDAMPKLPLELLQTMTICRVQYRLDVIQSIRQQHGDGILLTTDRILGAVTRHIPISLQLEHMTVVKADDPALSINQVASLVKQGLHVVGRAFILPHQVQIPRLSQSTQPMDAYIRSVNVVTHSKQHQTIRGMVNHDPLLAAHPFKHRRNAACNARAYECIISGMIGHEHFGLHAHIRDAHLGCQPVGISHWQRTDKAAIKLLQDHMRLRQIDLVCLRLVNLVYIEELVQRTRDQLSLEVEQETSAFPPNRLVAGCLLAHLSASSRGVYRREGIWSHNQVVNDVSPGSFSNHKFRRTSDRLPNFV